MKSLIISLIYFAALILIFANCSTVKVYSKIITDFTVNGVHGNITSNSVLLTLPHGTDLTSLTPIITIIGDSINPACGATQNFTNPVIYTITASDGSIRDYTVKITAASASLSDITDFVILGVHGAISGSTIALTLPYGTDISALTPIITINGAAVSLMSGVEQDFTSSVNYTVTAADGSTRIYNVTVTLASSDSKDVTDFVILGVHGSITADEITIRLPFGTDVTALVPALSTTGTGIIPAGGAVQDFTDPVLYTVTAADTTSKIYSVIVIPNRVNLGTASAYAVFGGSAGMTNQGLSTVITGDMGTTSAPSYITGFHNSSFIYTETPFNIGAVSGLIYTNLPAPGTSDSYAIANAAHDDALTAYTFLAALSGGVTIADQLGGCTLTPGIYKATSGAFSITGADLVLDAEGNSEAVWVFQAGSSLTVGGAGDPRSVTLLNGAQAKNIFWKVSSMATINGGGGGTMAGTIICNSGVIFSTAGNTVLTTLNGRALSLAASVTMVNTVIDVSGL